MTAPAAASHPASKPVRGRVEPDALDPAEAAEALVALAEDPVAVVAGGVADVTGAAVTVPDDDPEPEPPPDPELPPELVPEPEEFEPVPRCVGVAW